jgi:hypothetical protein
MHHENFDLIVSTTDCSTSSRARCLFCVNYFIFLDDACDDDDLLRDAGATGKKRNLRAVVVDSFYVVRDN